MKDESNSKQTFKITLTCPSAQQLIYQPGELKETIQTVCDSSLKPLLNMLLGYVDLHVTQMEVEEVNQSQKLTTPQPCTTKEQCSKSTTCATSQGTEEAVECKSDHRAPHGFLRNESASLDRYVCECEFWEPLDD